MKKVVILTAAIVSATRVSAADHLAPSSFNYSPTLIIAIIVGIITSAITLYSSRRLMGNLKITQLLLGSGMLAVVFGFVVVAFPIINSEAISKVLHDVAFIIGYGIMFIASMKFSKIIQNLKK